MPALPLPLLQILNAQQMMNTSRNRCSVWFASLLSVASILAGCETEHHDYIYNLKVSTTDSVLVSYQIIGEDDSHQMVLKNGDLVRLCKRAGVEGDDIWNIETSSTIYKIESLTAYAPDLSSKTENMNRRKYWPGMPQCVGDSAFYTVELTDDCFILDKLQGFSYGAVSFAEDTVIVTSVINGDLRKDTLFGVRNAADLGVNDIYVYNGNATKSDQDKRLQMLSGISSISLKMKRNGTDVTRIVSLQREDSLFSFTEEGCTLNIHERHFDKKQNNKK